MRTAVLSLLLAAGSVCAQPVKWPVALEKFSKTASEVVDITLDGNMLQLASRFLNGKSPDEAKVKKLIAGLKGIYVKSFEFSGENAYQEADLEAMRSQLGAPAWSRIMGVRSRRDGDNVDIFVRLVGSRIGGLVLIAAEPKELTLIQIDGQIDPDQLADLSGHFGIPRLELEKPKTGKGDKK